jgi:hypothetical protein
MVVSTNTFDLSSEVPSMTGLFSVGLYHSLCLHLSHQVRCVSTMSPPNLPGYSSTSSTGCACLGYHGTDLGTEWCFIQADCLRCQGQRYVAKQFNSLVCQRTPRDVDATRVPTIYGAWAFRDDVQMRASAYIIPNPF